MRSVLLIAVVCGLMACEGSARADEPLEHTGPQATEQVRPSIMQRWRYGRLGRAGQQVPEGPGPVGSLPAPKEQKPLYDDYDGPTNQEWEELINKFLSIPALIYYLLILLLPISVYAAQKWARRSHQELQQLNSTLEKSQQELEKLNQRFEEFTGAMRQRDSKIDEVFQEFARNIREPDSTNPDPTEGFPNMFSSNTDNEDERGLGCLVPAGILLLITVLLTIKHSPWWVVGVFIAVAITYDVVTDIFPNLNLLKDENGEGTTDESTSDAESNTEDAPANDIDDAPTP